MSVLVNRPLEDVPPGRGFPQDRLRLVHLGFLPKAKGEGLRSQELQEGPRQGPLQSPAAPGSADPWGPWGLLSLGGGAARGLLSPRWEEPEAT